MKYEKSKINQQKSIINPVGKKAFQLKDNRKQTVLQQKPNKTGLPDNLKLGIENLSGHSLDDVKVHYNSSKPGKLNAHAYAQGNQIHLGSGQEKHLPHEAWHVVQQKQGRVRPTMQMKGANINDNIGLENEADVMGDQAIQSNPNQSTIQKKSKPKLNTSINEGIVQLSLKKRFRNLFGLKEPLNEGTRLVENPGMEMLHQQVELGEAERRLESNVGAKASMASSIGSGLATAVGKPADLVGKLSQSRTSAEALKVSGTAGGIGGILGATGSLVDAGVNLHKHYTGNQLKGDKHLLKMDIASNLSNVGTSVASSVGGFAAAIGNASTVASSAVAAGPFAAVGGGVDLLRGGIGAKVASNREQMLKDIGSKNESNLLTKSIAHFAEDGQETRKKSEVGNAIKGGLGLAGGLALLAGAGPVGWGLLGAGALVGLGVKGYQTWRKYKHGKKALDGGYSEIIDQSTLQEGVKNNKKWYHPSFYKKVLAHDLVRSSAGGKLSDPSSGVTDQHEIINSLGLDSGKARAKEITEAL